MCVCICVCLQGEQGCQLTRMSWHEMDNTSGVHPNHLHHYYDIHCIMSVCVCVCVWGTQLIAMQGGVFALCVKEQLMAMQDF